MTLIPMKKCFSVLLEKIKGVCYKIADSCLSFVSVKSIHSPYSLNMVIHMSYSCPFFTNLLRRGEGLRLIGVIDSDFGG